jgi:methyl-accepting chemotaxis protein
MTKKILLIAIAILSMGIFGLCLFQNYKLSKSLKEMTHEVDELKLRIENAEDEMNDAKSIANDAISIAEDAISIAEEANDKVDNISFTVTTDY